MTTAEAPVRLSKPQGEAASGGAVYVHVPVARDAGNWIEVFYVPDNGTQEVRDDPAIALRFSDLVEWWHSDTDGMSFDRDKFDHPAYRRIVALGKSALPYILADLRDRQGHWFEALRQLSKDNGVDTDANGSMRRAREAWLSWGKAMKLI